MSRPKIFSQNWVTTAGATMRPATRMDQDYFERATSELYQLPDELHHVYKFPQEPRMKGVFAVQDLPEGAYLGQYLGRLYPGGMKELLKLRPQCDTSYTFEASAGWLLDAADDLYGTWLKFINAPVLADPDPFLGDETPGLENCEFREDVHDGLTCVVVVTTRRVPAGKELLVRYGEDEQKICGWAGSGDVRKKAILDYVLVPQALRMLGNPDRILPDERYRCPCCTKKKRQGTKYESLRALVEHFAKKRISYPLAEAAKQRMRVLLLAEETAAAAVAALCGGVAVAAARAGARSPPSRKRPYSMALSRSAVLRPRIDVIDLTMDSELL
eukprot:TRINITY_DN6102_c0_g1_i2.p1 TRINITY_DN6102_c0_g1~~TRINITY_DN6102_c0_g1_i2.p1  ORF type:complete len:329 (+),score=26.98 TRINITY_DN6102_c0_g1_i2:100-1086(+)